MTSIGLKGLAGQQMGPRRRKSAKLIYANGFTSSGSTPAQTVPVLAQVWLIAPGGGGGGYTTSDGGGGGGAVYDEFPLAPGQVLTFTIGAAGIAAQSAPTTAGDVVLTGPSGRTVRAQGGQGRIGGRGLGGKRNYKGGDGGTAAGTDPTGGSPAGGAPGAAGGGDGQNGEGGAGSYGGGGGGAANPGTPLGLLASSYPAATGRAGANSGTVTTADNYGAGGGASSDSGGGSHKGGAGGAGVVIVAMVQAPN